MSDRTPEAYWKANLRLMLMLESKTQNLQHMRSDLQPILQCKFQPMQSKCTADMDIQKSILLLDSCVGRK